MKNHSFGVLGVCAALLSIASSAHATISVGGTATEYGYQFTPPTANGFGGELYFKEAQNASGSVSDIDLNNSYLTTPDGGFNLSLSYFFLGVTYTGPITQVGTLSWNPTAITSMNLSGETAAYLFGIFETESINWSITPSNMCETPTYYYPFPATEPDPFSGGVWDFAGTITVASTPDHVNSALLLLLAMPSLAIWGMSQKKLKLARA